MSYASPDRARISRLAEAITARGFTVWWDHRIEAGAEYSLDIERELDDAELVVVAWSAAAVASPWVKDEASIGQEQGKLLPLSLDGQRPPLGFRQYQVLDLSTWCQHPDSPPPDDLWLTIERRLRPDRDREAARPEARVDETRGPAIMICVLPFLNLSGDPEQQYFSDGITEDVITDLSKVSAMTVVSRNAAFAFGQDRPDLAAVKARTGASHVLEGSVRKSGHRVRISARLIQIGSDSTVWAERYDADLDDIFALQDQISRAITAALSLTLGGGEEPAEAPRGTRNAAAYQLYLMARQFWVRGSERHKAVIARICERAVELDPDYAAGWAMLALARWELHRRNVRFEGPAAAAERALALDPQLADSHAAQAAAYQEAGDYEQGLAACRRALELDPASVDAAKLAGFCALALNRVPEAIEFFEQAAAANDREFHATGMLGQCYEQMGDEERLVENARILLERVERIIETEPDHTSALGYGTGALVRLKQRERALSWAERALLLEPDNVNLRYGLACSMTMLGEADRALDLLESIIGDASAGTLSWIDHDHDLQPLRGLPRFQAMVAKARQHRGAAPEEQDQTAS